MSQLELTKEEAEVLEHVLNGFRSELRMEIAGTDSGFYRRNLKREREIIDQILGKLKVEQTEQVEA